MASPLYPLERYLKAHPDVTKTALAVAAETSPAKVCDLIAGRLRRPSPELADRFEVATKKEVTARELLFFRAPVPRKRSVAKKIRRKAS